MIRKLFFLISANEVTKFKIRKPWVACLSDNKKIWKEQATKGTYPTRHRNPYYYTYRLQQRLYLFIIRCRSLDAYLYETTRHGFSFTDAEARAKQEGEINDNPPQPTEEQYLASFVNSVRTSCCKMFNSLMKKS